MSTIPPSRLTLAIIGGGSLGTAFASGVLAATANSNANSHFKADHVYVTVHSAASRKRVESALRPLATSTELSILAEDDEREANLQAVRAADVVLLAIKPVQREKVIGAPGVRDALHKKLVISIMAGVSLRSLRDLVARPTTAPPAKANDVHGNGAADATAEGGEEEDVPALVRAMPNMAAQIREAITLYTTTHTVSELGRKRTAWLLECVGAAKEIEEKDFDIAAVLVGCAGSLLLLAIDGLLDAAVAEGIKRPEATELALQSAIGMLKLVPAGQHPSVLREKIASPGGCSIRALLELEKRGVRSAFTDALLKASERSRSISRS